MRFRNLLLLVIVLGFAFGCALNQGRPDYSGIFWPKAPDRPRIQLLKIIYSSKDVAQANTASKLLGASGGGWSFMKPHGVAVDDNDNVYVSDTGNIGIDEFNLDTGETSSLTPMGGWSLPGAIAVDNADGLIAAVNGKKIDMYDLKTHQDKYTIGQGGDFNRPAGLAFDQTRKILYVSDSRDNRLYAYSIYGKREKVLAKPGLKKGNVFYPLGLATDAKGNLYEVDSMNWRIKVFSPEGKEIRTWGKHGDRTGMFDRPKALAISKDGFVFVTDAQFCNFQVFDELGRAYMFFGDPGDKPGRFLIPEGIAVDDQDRIYVADSQNGRVEIFQLMTDAWWAKHPEGLAYFKTHPNGGF